MLTSHKGSIAVDHLANSHGNVSIFVVIVVSNRDIMLHTCMILPAVMHKYLVVLDNTSSGTCISASLVIECHSTCRI